MLNNNGQDNQESGKMFALTIVLTNFLILLVAGGLFRLAQVILTENNRLAEITRGFNLF
jgi:hypothetical protein